MIYSGNWSGSSYQVDCSYSIKEGNTTKYSGYTDRTISETTTAGSSLTVSCSHDGIAGKLTLNVKMKPDPIRISNLAEFYAYTGSNITVSPTVSDADNSTTLAAGTDYDVTFSPATVKDKGVYTATISGKGSYSFTKTFNFLVGTLEYVDENGTTQTKAQDGLTLLTTRNDLPATLTGWYLVADNITFSHVVEIKGTAHLILADGTTMNANRIRVNSGNALNIYGQTGGTGSLSVYPKGVVSNDAGIGSSQGNSCGAITINGGNINSEGMFSGAGIGAAPYNSCGTVTINGGVVTAKGKGGIADIGGEYGSVVINGGQITATSGGIGGTTVSLGWRDAAGDFVQAKTYSGEVSFQNSFIVDDGTNVDATADNIGGKKIVPKSGTITYNLMYATINGIEKAYAPNDAGIDIPYSVVYAGTIPMRAGTDYTAAITDGNSQNVDVIKTPGRYTLTITGIAPYTGTTTATIIVYGFKETLGEHEFSTSGDDDGLYYFVDSEAALRAIATYVNSGNDAYGKRFVQTQDIVMTGDNFTPIGKHQTGGELFDGIYDGRNFTISNLTVNSDYGYIGLFGGIGNWNRGATVKNVVLVNPTVKASNSGNLSADVGTLVGSCNDNCTVDNCIVINPTVTISGTNKVAGAIVGMLYFNTNRLTNSYFYDSDASHSYAAVGSNHGGCHVSNVERVYTLTATGCTATATATVAVSGTDYYKSGTPVTVTAAVPSSGMKKLTSAGTTVTPTETVGQYTLTMPAGDVTVSLTDVTPAITLAADGLTYTGAAHTPAITSVMDGETVMTEGTDYTDVTYSNNTNAGTATVAITGKGFYLGAAAQTFGIARRSVTLTSASGSKTYDGSALTAGGVTVGGDGFVEGEGATCHVTGTLTDVGSNNNAFTYTLNDGTLAANYDITKVEGTLTVTPLTGVTVTITGHTESATYDGSAHIATGYDVDTSSQLYTSADFTFSGTAEASLTDTGIAYMGLAAGQFANTNPNFADVTFNVTDGSVTVSYYNASFADNASNTDAISDIITNYGSKANVTLAGRTLYKDNAWNTLCLPFDVTLSGSVLNGATLMELDVTNTSFDDATGTLYLYFKDAENITAGTPYIIKWASGDNIVSPVFEGVTVSATTASSVQSADGKVQFIGTYNPVDIYSAECDNLYLAADNQLCWPEGEGMTSYLMNTFRAYFHVGDGQTPAPVRHTVLNFGDGATGVIAIDNGQWMMDNEAGAWYDISGRRLDAAPAAKGIYIVNGRKVVIK